MAAASNPFLVEGRRRKAASIVDLALKEGWTADQLRRMGEVEWTMLAIVAKIKPPSEETRRMAIALLDSQEALRTGL